MVQIIVSNADAIKMLKSAEWNVNWYSNTLDPNSTAYPLLTPTNIKNLKKSLKYWELHAHQIRMGLIVAGVKFKSVISGS